MAAADLGMTCRRWIAGCLVLTGFLAGAARLSPVEAQARTLAAQKAAPSFSRTDLNGKRVALSAYRGKVVLLNFWATWCAPCLAEIPVFADWQKEYGGRGLQVIGVSMDDDAPPVRRLYQKYRLNYPVVMGDENLGELYGGVLGLPISYLIDSKGKIVKRYEGTVDLKQFEGEIQRLLPK